MRSLLRAKLIVGGLGVMLFAKAAMSFPEIPMFNTNDPVKNQFVVKAAAKDEATLEAATDFPPLVTGLPEMSNELDVPEEILRSLTRERELVAMQKAELEKRRAQIALSEERLRIEQASLSELKGSIEALLARIEASQTEDLDRLIDLYKNMKPADAARIIDDLDIETTIMILGTMNPRIAAPILAKVAPVRARAVSKIILERSQLPGDQDLVGIKLQ